MLGSPRCRTRSARFSAASRARVQKTASRKAPATRVTGHAAFRIANRFEKSGLAMPTTDAVKLGYRPAITALARRQGAPNSYVRLLSLRISLERFGVYSS